MQLTKKQAVLLMHDIYFRRRKKKIGNTIQVHVKGNKIYFGALDYVSVLFSLPTPPIRFTCTFKKWGHTTLPSPSLPIITHSIYF